MKIFALKQLKNLIKKQGISKVSKEALFIFSEALEEIALEIILVASGIAKRKKKKLVGVKDIKDAEKIILGKGLKKEK